MRKTIASRIVSGLFIIAFGMVILLQVLGIVYFPDLTDKWWVLFIIVPGVAGIASSGFHFWNVFLVFLGAWLLVEDQSWFKTMVGEKGWPIFLGVSIIVFGVWVVLGGHHHVHNFEHTKPNTNEDSDNFPEYTSVFSSVSYVNKSKSFRGGKASSVFGSITVDLREISLTSNATFEVSGVFGSIELILPRTIPIKVDVIPVFGAISNIAPLMPMNGQSYLEIKGAAVFGTVKII
jgi:predicted membrane protein